MFPAMAILLPKVATRSAALAWTVKWCKRSMLSIRSNIYYNWPQGREKIGLKHLGSSAEQDHPMRGSSFAHLGTRKRIDFETIEKHVVRPAVKNIGAERGTTERFSKPAISTSTSLSSCRSADLVVADITTKNPNTYYDSAPVDFATASRRTRGPGSSGPGSPRASSQRELGRTHDVSIVSREVPPLKIQQNAERMMRMRRITFIRGVRG